jgi:hypothetical protein
LLARIGVIDVRTGAIRRKRKSSSASVQENLGRILEGPLKGGPLSIGDITEHEVGGANGTLTILDIFSMASAFRLSVRMPEKSWILFRDPHKRDRLPSRRQ